MVPGQKEAIEFCDSILERVEELPPRAADFAESVQNTVLGIKDSIIKFHDVTNNQRTALQNILGGVKKWLRE